MSWILFMLVSRLITRPHRVRSHGCCRRGESTLPFCRGCNSIRQTGEHPQSCGPGWHPRSCAQSMCLPTSRGFYRHLSICPSLCLWFPHASKNPPLCPYLRKIKSHAWILEARCSDTIFSKCFEKLIRDHICSVLPASLDHYNLHTAETAPQTTLLPSPCTLLSLPPGK